MAKTAREASDQFQLKKLSSFSNEELNIFEITILSFLFLFHSLKGMRGRTDKKLSLLSTKLFETWDNIKEKCKLSHSFSTEYKEVLEPILIWMQNLDGNDMAIIICILQYLTVV